MPQAQPSSSDVRKTVTCACLYLFGAYLSFAMTMTPLPEMSLQWACEDVGLSWSRCNSEDGGAAYQHAQEASSSWCSRLDLCRGIFQVAMCGFYGVLGDAYGRRYALAIPAFGLAAQYLVMGVVPSSRKDDIFMVLTLVASLGGGNYATNHAACASISDVTQRLSPKERARVFGLVEAATWGGLLFGPVLGGSLAKLLGNQLAMVPATVVATLTGLFIIFCYPETLDASRREPFSFTRGNPIAAYSMFLHNRFVALLALMLGFGMFSFTGAANTLPNNVNRLVPHLDPAMLGLMQTVGLGSGCVGLCALFPLIMKRLSMQAVLSLGMLNGIIGWVLMAFAHSLWQFYAINASLLLTAVMYPIMRVGMTSTFGSRRYGEALAAMGTLEQTMGMIAPACMQQIYRATLSSSVYILDIQVYCVSNIIAAGFAVIGLVVTFFLRFPQSGTSGPADNAPKGDAETADATN